ncbi:MAG: hypothetical protein ACI92S_005445 [Planctomycetaceae bacterium]|jgi:hypothetical protein
MCRRTLSLIAVFAMSTTSVEQSSASRPATMPASQNGTQSSPSLFAALQAAPTDNEFISLIGQTPGQHQNSDDGYSSTNIVPQSCIAACGETGYECSVNDRWDFSQGLLTFLHEDTGHRYTGFLDFNYYGDTRNFSVLTVNAGAKLPYDFEYFQFVNYTSQLGNESALENWTDFFTEIHLRRPIAKDSEWFKHLDWTVMWADGSGPQEVGRLGVRWRFQDTPGPIGSFFRDTLKLNYSLNFHFLEDDGSGWQMEHVYRRSFLDGLVYVGGFADHNVNGTADSSDWVSETQVGVKLLGNFYAVAEYRYFSFANSSRFKQGVGIGVEYAIRFQ